jgi:hypothetical protein
MLQLTVVVPTGGGFFFSPSISTIPPIAFYLSSCAAAPSECGDRVECAKPASTPANVSLRTTELLESKMSMLTPTSRGPLPCPKIVTFEDGDVLPSTVVGPVIAGKVDWDIPIDLNTMLMKEKWDLIVNLGHVVPHDLDDRYHPDEHEEPRQKCLEPWVHTIACQWMKV